MRIFGYEISIRKIKPTGKITKEDIFDSTALEFIGTTLKEFNRLVSLERLSEEEIEQIEMILEIEETGVRSALKQQYVKILYDFYKKAIKTIR